MNNETNGSTVTSTSKPEMTYAEKMDFLAMIRKEVGLDKVNADTHTDECAPGKYITEYTFGTI
ncbi:MAG: hypothetical protein EBT92_14300 [Planctomycetes bacterium]|nr:hypothetical protein [Planctomycetota bacterium]